MSQSDRITRYKEMLISLQKETNRKSILRKVNTFFNREISYTHDIYSQKMTDYWQCLSETLQLGTGDCDDYAIAKYMTLKKLGFGTDEMFLGHVVLPEGGHLVLYVLDGKPDKTSKKNKVYILDNRYGSLMNYFNVREYKGNLFDLINESDDAESLDETDPKFHTKLSSLLKLKKALRKEQDSNLL